MFFIHFCRWSWTYCNPMTHFLSTIPSSETKKGEGGREEKKSVDRKKRRKKKNRWRIRQKIADTFSPRIIVDFSTRLRYKRAYNGRYSLTCMIDISIRERERERERSFSRKELAITRRYDHFERNWIPYKGGELYREKRNGLTHIQGILLEEDNLRNSLSPLNRAMIRIVFPCTSSGNEKILLWKK